MEIRCIALDLDRTTLDGDGYLPEENRKALEEVMEGSGGQRKGPFHAAGGDQGDGRDTVCHYIKRSCSI